MLSNKRTASEVSTSNKRVSPYDLPWSSALCIYKKYYPHNVVVAAKSQLSKIFHARRRWIEVLLMIFNRLDKLYPGLGDPLVNVVFCQIILPEFFSAAVKLHEEETLMLKLNATTTYRFNDRGVPITWFPKEEISGCYSDLLETPSVDTQKLAAVVQRFSELSTLGSAALKPE